MPELQTSEIFGRLADELERDWQCLARPEQLPPIGDEWDCWLFLAGRGAGKTRSMAEAVRANVCGSTPLGRGKYKQIALVAETAADARDVLVGEGKVDGVGSGLLRIHSKDFRPTYEPSKRKLTWPNGAFALLFNATEPD